MGIHLTNLPNQPTTFIRRSKEVAAVQQQLLRQDIHLVTLTGPGGVGKTRLCLQVAAEVSEHFADGTWFLYLAPITDPDLVIPTIAHTLGVREATDHSLSADSKRLLQKRQLLLVLDNFEQIVSAANQVADIAERLPKAQSAGHQSRDAECTGRACVSSATNGSARSQAPF